MKKSSKLLVAVVVLIAILTVTYRLVNRVPSSDLPVNEQLQQIVTEAGCLSCHSAEPDLPFYASWPIAGKIVQKDMEEAYRVYDASQMMVDLENRTILNQVDLAKLEQAVNKGNMPPAKYYLVHWGSSITDAKGKVVMDGVKYYRAQLAENSGVAPEFVNEPIRPIADSIPVDPRKVALGEQLYFDTRLSADNTISCSSCHGLNTGGVDNEPFSDGVGGQLGGVNAPTVYNAYYNFVQFWDGRALTLAEQAAGPPLNPVEMACESFDEIIAKLAEDKAFTKAFKEVYPDGWTEKNITEAIEEFEKTLLTPDSRFDLYLKGDKSAITEEELEGYKLFKKYDCATCHAGENLGGLTYELMGIKKDYFADRNMPLTIEDNGRFKETKNERDRHRFKVPGLRNIALTYPYYHDATKATLEEAVDNMAEYEVGVKLSSEEVTKMVAFLNTLTGKYKGVTLVNDNDKN